MQNNSVVLIDKKFPSDSNSVEIQFPADIEKYAMLEVIISNLSPTSDHGKLKMQYFVNGRLAIDKKYSEIGWSADTGASRFAGYWDEDAFYLYDGHRLGAKANYGLCGKISIFPQSSGSGYTSFMSNLFAPVAHNSQGCINLFDGAYKGAEAKVTGLLFKFDEPNKINAGTIYLYGWLKE